MKRFFLLLCLVSILKVTQAQKQLTVGILDDIKAPQSNSFLIQLKSEISSVVGKGTVVVFKEVLYNNHKLSNAEKNYNTLLNSETDIVLAFGIVNTIMLSKQDKFPKSTIIVGAVNNDFVDIPEDKKTSGINNLTYLVTPFSYKEDLDAFYSIYNFKKPGVIVDDYLLNLLPIKNQFDQYFSGKDAEYILIPINSSTDINQILSDVDAVYLASVAGIDDQKFEQLIELINQKHLPSLSGYGVDDVEKGILMTNQPAINFDQIIRRIALNVEAINNGTNASNLNLHINYKKQISINTNTADQIGLPIRNSWLARINLIEGKGGRFFGTQYTLVDLMNGVIDANLALQAEKQNIDLGEQDLKSSKSQFLPDVSLTAGGTYIDPDLAEVSNGQSPEFSTSGDVTLTQVIYSEEAAANISIQKKLLASQKESYNASELGAILDASVAYYNALVLKTNLSIQNNNLQMTKRNLEIAQQNLELGASGKSDVLRFQSQLAQNTQGMIEAKNSLSQAYHHINQLLNQEIDTQIDVKDTVLNIVLEESSSYQYLLTALDDPQQQVALTKFFINEAKRNSPELRNIGLNIEATKRLYKLYSKGRYVPTLALQGQYKRTFSRSGAGSDIPVGFPELPDGYYNVGLNLSFPIFQQNTRNINKQTATIQADQLNFQREDIELVIEQRINDVVLDLMNEVTNIEISKVDLDFASESLELSQNEYQNGAIPVIQLIDAQNNYFKARQANATAQYNFSLVLMQLQRLIGYFFDMNSPAENEDFTLRAKQYILSNQ